MAKPNLQVAPCIPISVSGKCSQRLGIRLCGMELALSATARARLMRPVNGEGGFQQLLRKLQTQLAGVLLTVDAADRERLERYSHAYGLGGF